RSAVRARSRVANPALDRVDEGVRILGWDCRRVVESRLNHGRHGDRLTRLLDEVDDGRDHLGLAPGVPGDRAHQIEQRHVERHVRSSVGYRCPPARPRVRGFRAHCTLNCCWTTLLAPWASVAVTRRVPLPLTCRSAICAAKEPALVRVRVVWRRDVPRPFKMSSVIVAGSDTVRWSVSRRPLPRSVRFTMAGRSSIETVGGVFATTRVVVVVELVVVEVVVVVGRVVVVLALVGVGLVVVRGGGVVVVVVGGGVVVVEEEVVVVVVGGRVVLVVVVGGRVVVVEEEVVVVVGVELRSADSRATKASWPPRKAPCAPPAVPGKTGDAVKPAM